jgi:PAP2 superfamily
MNYKIKLILTIIFVINTIVIAQTNSGKQLQKLPIKNIYETNFDNQVNIKWYQTFSNIPRDELGFFTENFKSENLPEYISIGLLTGALVSYDQNSWTYTKKINSRSSFLRNFSKNYVLLGNGGAQFLISGLFASYGFLSNDERAIRTASNITEAVLSTGLLIQILKRITGRESPAAATYKTGIWDLFPGINEYQGDQPKFYSFPSGHLATATATLTVIANNYPEVKWIKPIGYSILGLLGFSLVCQGMHWYSDLPLAFIIGTSMGNIIAPVQWNDNGNGTGNDKDHILILPDINKNTGGLEMIYSF